MRAGIKATPMPGDAEAVEMLYEDEWLVAVNKPPCLVRPRSLRTVVHGNILDQHALTRVQVHAELDSSASPCWGQYGQQVDNVLGRSSKGVPH